MAAPAANLEARPRRSTRRRLAEFALFLVALYIVISIAAAYALTRGTHMPLQDDPNVMGAPHEDVSFTSREGNITLKGWLFHAPLGKEGRSVVMAHGFKQNRVNGNYTAGVARDLLAHGYDVLMFDQRSCGESGGDVTTIGDKERYDVLAAYDFMKGRGYVPAKMTMMGLSMGAGATIMAAPQMPDVAAIVPDSSFAELRPILETEIGKLDYMPAFVNWGVLAAAPLFGGNPDLRPVDVVKSMPERAFLFYHGDADQLIPVAHAHELRAASANTESDLIITPGAYHGLEYYTDRDAYMNHLYRFIDQQIAEKTK